MSDGLWSGMIGGGLGWAGFVGMGWCIGWMGWLFPTADILFLAFNDE